MHYSRRMLLHPFLHCGRHRRLLADHVRQSARQRRSPLADPIRSARVGWHQTARTRSTGRLICHRRTHLAVGHGRCKRARSTRHCRVYVLLHIDEPIAQQVRRPAAFVHDLLHFRHHTSLELGHCTSPKTAASTPVAPMATKVAATASLIELRRPQWLAVVDTVWELLIKVRLIVITVAVIINRSRMRINWHLLNSVVRIAAT